MAGVGTPGDCDDIDVGVEALLKAPGDSERRVEDPLSWPSVGVGGGRLGVDDGSGGVLRLLKLAMRELEVANSEPDPRLDGAYAGVVFWVEGIVIVPNKDLGLESV